MKSPDTTTSSRRTLIKAALSGAAMLPQIVSLEQVRAALTAVIRRMIEAPNTPKMQFAAKADRT